MALYLAMLGLDLGRSVVAVLKRGLAGSTANQSTSILHKSRVCERVLNHLNFLNAEQRQLTGNLNTHTHSFLQPSAEQNTLRSPSADSPEYRMR